MLLIKIQQDPKLFARQDPDLDTSIYISAQDRICVGIKQKKDLGPPKCSRKDNRQCQKYGKNHLSTIGIRYTYIKFRSMFAFLVEGLRTCFKCPIHMPRVALAQHAHLFIILKSSVLIYIPTIAYFTFICLIHFYCSYPPPPPDLKYLWQ